MFKGLASLIGIGKLRSCLNCALIYSAKQKPGKHPDQSPERAVWETSAQI